MLRLILVTAPSEEHHDAQVDALREGLAGEALSECAAPAALLAPAARIARPHALDPREEPRLGEPGAAVAAIEEVAARLEGTLLAVVEEAVARAVVWHALAAPEVAGRLAFDAGGYAEIEVRGDAPWTVNRLNERCHDPHSSLGGRFSGEGRR